MNGNGGQSGKLRSVEAYRSIDIRDWSRDGLLKAGISFKWIWHHIQFPIASIVVETGPKGVWLNYTVQVKGSSLTEIYHFVPITTTPCNFGGIRKWFLCPGRSCNRRVAILYGAGHLFLCRHCYNLTYRSCQTSGDELEKCIRHAMKIKRRLGIDQPGLLYDHLPDKPPYMHWDTYSSLVTDLKKTISAGLRVAIAGIR